MFRLFDRACDPISFETHFIGACCSVVGAGVMIALGLCRHAPVGLFASACLFMLCVLCLYSASSMLHFYQGSAQIKELWRKLDHSMIYVLIAGTYTPVIVYCYRVPRAFYFLLALWLLAAAGIVMKLLWINAPRVLSTSIYLLLGWSILYDVHCLALLPLASTVLIALGGCAYSAGAVIYMIKRPNFSARFGFHELFHIFVMFGTACHYAAVLLFFFA